MIWWYLFSLSGLYLVGGAGYLLLYSQVSKEKGWLRWLWKIFTWWFVCWTMVTITLITKAAFG